MDGVTHSMTGWAIARAFPQSRWGTWIMPVAVIGANLPDFELFFVPRGDKPYYLMHHRGWSHCLLGIGLEVLAFSAIVVGIGWLLSRRRPEIRRPRWGPVLTIVSVTALSHLLLDWWNTYGVRPFFPFDDTRFHADLTFLVDPWIWLMLFGGILLGAPFWKESSLLPLSGRMRAVTVVALMLLGLAMGGSLSFAASVNFIPGTVPWIWITAITVIFLIRGLLIREVRPRLVAGIALTVVGIYVCGLGWISHSAHEKGLRLFEQRHSEPVVSSSANPYPSVPWRYEILVQTSRHVYQYSVNVLQGTVEEVREVAHNLDDPGLRRLEGDRRYQAWRMFARHPLAKLENGYWILGDARYQVVAGRGDWTELRAPVR